VATGVEVVDDEDDDEALEQSQEEEDGEKEEMELDLPYSHINPQDVLAESGAGGALHIHISVGDTYTHTLCPTQLTTVAIRRFGVVLSWMLV
jgi:hypothetical protein